MHDGQNDEPRSAELAADRTPVAAEPPHSTVEPSGPRRSLRRWLIIGAAVLCLGAGAAVLIVRLTGRSTPSAFGSASDLMDALKARGVTCRSETAVSMDGATSAINCVTRPGDFISAMVYPTQAAADGEYQLLVHDDKAIARLNLGVVYYYAKGPRWLVVGTDGPTVQLAAHAFNGTYQAVAT